MPWCFESLLHWVHVASWFWSVEIWVGKLRQCSVYLHLPFQTTSMSLRIIDKTSQSIAWYPPFAGKHLHKNWHVSSNTLPNTYSQDRFSTRKFGLETCASRDGPGGPGVTCQGHVPRTLPETNIAPKISCLEDDNSFWDGWFSRASC